MSLLLLLFLIVIPFEQYEFTDIKGKKYDIERDEYIIIYFNSWNCVDCIKKTTDYLKTNKVPKEKIYFVIESPKDIYSRANLKKMIELRTSYYNAIVFNPQNVNLNDVKTSYFLKHSDNNRTPALLIKSDKLYFYQYDDIFLKNNDVIIDSEGVKILKDFKD